MVSAKELPQFEFLGKLGVGGTAQVDKVRTVQHKIAALKTILQSENINQEEFKLLAIREQHLLQNINFPGIVKIYEVQTKEPCYICLEYCSGKTLETYHKIESLQSALNILSSIAINLEFLHLKSIVHADLKPDNIFMPEDISLFDSDKLTFTKLSDFSLGKFEIEDDSVRGGVGTVGYMAPETIKENIVSHRSDLFAFGVLAYQMVTGVHPFITDDADPVKINSRILEEIPLPLTDLRNDLPAEFIQLINQLMDKDASKRPSSAWEVCQKLKQAGATYPFEKVLHPKYAIESDKSYSTNQKVIANYHKKIDIDSDKTSPQLRLLLSDNFDKNNLYYSDRQFHFKSNPLVASYLIRQTIKEYLKLSYTNKKNAIQLALQDENRNLLASLLPHLLHKRTISRLSSRLAILNEQKENYKSAASLFVMSGNLEKAENCAYQAAMKFKNDNNNDKALEVLNKVISYGALVSKLFSLKTLIMLKGDILKDSGDVEGAEIIYNQLIDLYDGHPEDELLAETYKDLGDLYKMKRKPEEGIKALEKALDIYQNLGKELDISKTYNNLGNIYTLTNNYKTSLSYFRKALKIQRKLTAEELVASTLNNIATTYATNNRFQKALRIFKISLSIKEKIGNKGEIARALNNIGYCYEVIGNASKAVEVLHESMRFNKEIDSKGEILFNLENLTAIMFSTGQLKESISYLKEGINLATILNDKPHIGIFNLYLGAVFIRLGKLNDGKKRFELAEDILKTIEDSYLLALLYIEKAQLATLIDNKSKALKLLNDAQLIYEEMNNKTILIKIILVKLTLISNLTILSEAEIIVNDLKLTKEKPLLLANKINYFLNNVSIPDVDSAYQKLEDFLQNTDQHIEQCYLLITATRYNLHLNNLSKASQYAMQSVKIARTRNLKFDLYSSLILHGKVLGMQNEIERCFSIYKEALSIAKNIFNQLETTEDKQAFQNKKEFLFLVAEIKKLSQIIGQKKEQVS